VGQRRRYQPTSYYDLYRIEKGRIAEHWDTLEPIPPRADWKNVNGKFSRSATRVQPPLQFSLQSLNIKARQTAKGSAIARHPISMHSPLLEKTTLFQCFPGTSNGSLHAVYLTGRV
jgi:hypothetical protein